MPEDRPDPPLAWLGQLLFRQSHGFGLIDAFQRSARETDDGSPFKNSFPEDVVVKIRRLVAQEVGQRMGASVDHLLEVAAGQPFCLNLLTALGQLAGSMEPDSMYPCSLKDGVPLGVDEEMPRTPTVYSPKLKHRIPFS